MLFLLFFIVTLVTMSEYKNQYPVFTLLAKSQTCAVTFGKFQVRRAYCAGFSLGHGNMSLRTDLEQVSDIAEHLHGTDLAHVVEEHLAGRRGVSDMDARIQRLLDPLAWVDSQRCV